MSSADSSVKKVCKALFWQLMLQVQPTVEGTTPGQVKKVAVYDPGKQGSQQYASRDPASITPSSYAMRSYPDFSSW